MDSNNATCSGGSRGSSSTATARQKPASGVAISGGEPDRRSRSAPAGNPSQIGYEQTRDRRYPATSERKRGDGHACRARSLGVIRRGQGRASLACVRLWLSRRCRLLLGGSASRPGRSHRRRAAPSTCATSLVILPSGRLWRDNRGRVRHRSRACSAVCRRRSRRSEAA